jgi:hypothetical protein
LVFRCLYRQAKAKETKEKRNKKDDFVSVKSVSHIVLSRKVDEIQTVIVTNRFGESKRGTGALEFHRQLPRERHKHRHSREGGNLDVG